MEGARKEDAPPRWVNHFYDPTTDLGWQGQKMGNMSQSNVLAAHYLFLSSNAPVSSLNWAANQELQNNYSSYQGNQTWQKAIYKYNQGNKKQAFTALGHILHLLQDLTVPAHTRQDTHYEAFGDPGEPYEKWAKENIDFSHLIGLSPDITCQSLNDCFIKLAKYSQENFFSEGTILDKVYELPLYIKEIDVKEIRYYH